MGFRLFRIFTPILFCILFLFSPGIFALGQNISSSLPAFYYSNLPTTYQERIFAWMRFSYSRANSDFSSAFRKGGDFAYSSASFTLDEVENLLGKKENPSVGNSSDYAAEENSETEKILVVLVDAYGTQNYSKVIITDVDMELSILIAKDIFDKLPGGIYTVVASSANDLISQKLIIQ